MEHEMALLDEATSAAKEALHAHGIQRHALPLRLPLNARQFAGVLPQPNGLLWIMPMAQRYALPLRLPLNARQFAGVLPQPNGLLWIMPMAQRYALPLRLPLNARQFAGAPGAKWFRVTRKNIRSGPYSTACLVRGPAGRQQHVAGSESDECTKYDASYPSIIPLWPDHEPDIRQSMEETQRYFPVILLPK